MVGNNGFSMAETPSTPRRYYAYISDVVPFALYDFENSRLPLNLILRQTISEIFRHESVPFVIMFREGTLRGT